MAKLRFLTNNALVLIHVANNPKSTLREIAAAVGITERAVQTVLGDMRQERLVRKLKVGRKNHYWVNYPVLLEYPLEGQFRTVVELAQALTELGRQLREGEIPMDFPEDDDRDATQTSPTGAPLPARR